MKQLYGYGVIVWLVINQIAEVTIDILSIAFLLGILCLFIVKEKYIDSVYSSIMFLVVSVAISQYNSSFLLLLSIPILDFFFYKRYAVGVLSLMITLYLFFEREMDNMAFPIIVSSLLGYVLGEKRSKEEQHISVLDEERRLRYRLEETQTQLVRSRKEIEHLAEIRERNRIAHEIHDHLGHRIAGVIFQIEAAKRMIYKDREKLETILQRSSQKLAEALELTRNTVYNIKADRKIGLEALEKLIHDFTFCPIVFEHKGDFTVVSSTNMKILEANVMESLTNATKHSKAKNIVINITIGKKHIRYYYKDDGVGCKNVFENLGLSGMRERVRNIGGTIAIDGQNGFLIVCHLPMENNSQEEEEGY